MVQSRGAGPQYRSSGLIPSSFRATPTEGRKVLSTMTTKTSRSESVQRAARRRGEVHRDGGDPRMRQGVAARSQLNSGRVGRASMNDLRRKQVMDGPAHVRAIRRLAAAMDDRERESRHCDAARGTSGERDAVVAFAAAKEQLAALIVRHLTGHFQ